jgi:hypothetical protein
MFGDALETVTLSVICSRISSCAGAGAGEAKTVRTTAAANARGRGAGEAKK